MLAGKGIVCELGRNLEKVNDGTIGDLQKSRVAPENGGKEDNDEEKEIAAREKGEKARRMMLRPVVRMALDSSASVEHPRWNYSGAVP